MSKRQPLTLLELATALETHTPLEVYWNARVWIDIDNEHMALNHWMDDAMDVRLKKVEDDG